MPSVGCSNGCSLLRSRAAIQASAERKQVIPRSGMSTSLRESDKKFRRFFERGDHDLVFTRLEFYCLQLGHRRAVRREEQECIADPSALVMYCRSVRRTAIIHGQGARPLRPPCWKASIYSNGCTHDSADQTFVDVPIDSHHAPRRKNYRRPFATLPSNAAPMRRFSWPFWTMPSTRLFLRTRRPRQFFSPAAEEPC